MSEPQKVISFLRHEGWVGPADLKDPLNIIGCGAVGSHAAVLAARMGFSRFRLWDNDVVEDYNVGNQAFYSSHIGLKKTEALKQVLESINPRVKVEVFDRFFSSAEDGEIDGPVYMAVDSMTARKDIYDVVFMNPAISVVVEQRLGFDHGEVSVIDPLNINALESWKNGLCNDEDVAEGPCNLRICTTLVQNTVSLGVHSICAYYASQRHSKKWEYTPRTIVRLEDDVTILKLS